MQHFQRDEVIADLKAVLGRHTRLLVRMESSQDPAMRDFVAAARSLLTSYWRLPANDPDIESADAALRACPDHRGEA